MQIISENTRITIRAALAEPAKLQQVYPSLLGLARKYGLRLCPPPPSGARAWHSWEIIARLAHVPEEVAQQGAHVMERAVSHGWPSEHHVGLEFADHMLQEARADPDAAFLRWLQLEIELGGHALERLAA